MNKKFIALAIIIFAIILIGGNFLRVNTSSIASGVVPHHLVAREIIESFFKYISSKEKPKNIILLSPDHFNVTNLADGFFISVDPDTKEFHNLAVSGYLLKKLDNHDFAFNNSDINFDHGIVVLLPYVKKYFPKSNILPILISATTPKKDIEKLIKTIDTYADSQTIIIASVDFSHHLPPKVADFHDVKSVATLVDFKEDDFENLEVDSWQSLYGARFFARLRGKESPNIIGQGNSSDFIEFDDSIHTEGVTSYFSVVFEKENNQKVIEKGRTILLVGDIVLGREVESLIKKNSVIYPFQKVRQFLRGVNIVFGNLEGSIVKEPQNFSFDSLKFNFLPQTTDGLSWASFNLFSLANNHTFDRDENGLDETKQFLKGKNMDFVGDPLRCTKDFLFEKEGILFLAFNKTFPLGCSDEEIINTTNLVRDLNPKSFLIISMHWGKEYQDKNSISQQELAHKIIEAGADVIFGHHPHMVQNIEIYKNKLIFYSLGNFIFDQYFLKETQEGLSVGVEIYDDKTYYHLFPLEINQCQPSLMSQKKTSQFLEELSLRSSPELRGEIRNGIINTTVF